MSLPAQKLRVPLLKEASLRRLLLAELSASQRTSLLTTHYPAVRKRFTDGMDETRQLDLWFELAPLPALETQALDWKEALLAVVLREHAKVSAYLQKLAAEDFVPSLQTCAYLIDRALAALATQPQLVARRGELEKLRPQPVSETLRVGLLGVTSSGKSALLNAVMGAAWLPEAPLPTTRVPVWCEYGPVAAARIYFVGNAEADPPPVELDAAALQAGELAALCDERSARDPSLRAITGIALTSPFAEILRDSGTTLIDTPGLDAEGHSQHHLIAMNEVLPTLDLVLYLKPVLAPFKAADLELIDAMVGHDQPVVLLLTKSDTVHEQLESTPWGGLALRKSAGQLIAEATQAAEAVLAEYPRLKRAGVLPVSAKLAKLAHLPSAEPGHAGGAEFAPRSGLLQLEKFLRELRTYKPELKAQRVGHILVRLLGRIAADLQDDTGTKSPIERAALDDRELEIQELGVAHAQVAAKLQAAQAKWLGDAGKLRMFVQQATDTLNVQTASQFESDLELLFREAIAEAAALRRDVQHQLDNFELTGELSGNAEPPTRRTEPPSNYRKWVKGEWTFENPFIDFLWRWKKAKGPLEKLVAPLGLRRYPDRAELDREQLLADISKDIERLGSYLDGKLAELTQLGLKQLQSQLDLERRARAQSLNARDSAPEDQRELAHREIVKLQALAQKLQAANLSQLPAVEPLPPPPERALRLPPTAPAALLGLVHSFGEQRLQRELLTVVGQLTRSARPKVLLLGSDRRPLIELMARLLHCIPLQDTFAAISADHWIRLDNQSPPAPVPVGARTWDGRQLGLSGCTILEHLTFVLAPADEHLTPLSADFIRRFDAVGVHLDVAQLGSGLSDLTRAGRRYVDALQSAAVPAFFINGQGSTLDQVLDELLLTIPAAVSKRFPGFSAWLVYSGYDARYSRFLALGKQALAEDRELVKLWEEHQLSFAAPFTHERLRRLSEHAKSHRPAAPRLTESVDEPR